MPSNDSEMTVIGRETTIRGEIEFEQSARILGTLEGKIRSRGEVQIGESAHCRADVDAQSVVVEGTLEGNITAHETLRLEKSAHLTGDILAASLRVEEGASFVGHCRVGDAAAEGAAAMPARTTTAQPRPASPATPQVDFKPPWRTTQETEAEAPIAETGAA